MPTKASAYLKFLRKSAEILDMRYLELMLCAIVELL